MGEGRVDGSFKSVILSLSKGKVVELRPWSVNGRSRRRTLSEGSNPRELSASSVDLRDTSRDSFLVGDAGIDWGLWGPSRSVEGLGGRRSLSALSVGNFLSPPGAKTSFAASSSCTGAGVEALEDCRPSEKREAPRRTGCSCCCCCCCCCTCCTCCTCCCGCCLGGGLSGRGSFGSGESESWYSKCSIAHFWLRTGRDNSLV